MQLIKSLMSIRLLASLEARNSMVLLQVLIGVITLLPFAVMRFWNHQILEGVLDLSLVVSFCLIGWHAYNSKNLFLVSLILATLYTLGFWFFLMAQGVNHITWLFVAGIAVHLILRVKEAFSLNVIQLSGAIAILHNEPAVNLLTVSVNFAMCMLFIGLFSMRMGNDNRKLKNLASHDSLTGVLNRRSLQEHLLVIEDRMKTEELFEGSIAMIDVDHFKFVNDTYGHPVGDEVLKRLTLVISQVFQNQLQIYRYGGEEFCIIFPMPLQEAEQAAELLRSKIEISNLLRQGRLTVSIGLSEIKPEFSAAEWLRQADNSLYLAKRSGRNQVRTFLEEGEAEELELEVIESSPN